MTIPLKVLASHHELWLWVKSASPRVRARDTVIWNLSLYGRQKLPFFGRKKSFLPKLRHIRNFVISNFHFNAFIALMGLFTFKSFSFFFADSNTILHFFHFMKNVWGFFLPRCVTLLYEKRIVCEKRMSSKSKGMKRRKMWGKIRIPSRVKARKKLCKRTLGNFFGYSLPSASTNVWTWGSIYGCSFNVHYPKSD